MSWNETITITPPAAPGNNATVKLIDTTTMFGNEAADVISLFGISRFEVSFLSVNQASAANGLKPYLSSDAGTNWDQSDAGITVAATVAGTINTYDYAVDRGKDFKLEYTAGATGPTTWRITIKAIVGQRVVAA